MLELRPNCECCNTDLAPDSLIARICSFECTFCADSSDRVLNRIFPNCTGELVPQPRRAKNKLKVVPASTPRVVNSAARSSNLKD